MDHCWLQSQLMTAIFPLRLTNRIATAEFHYKNSNKNALQLKAGHWRVQLFLLRPWSYDLETRPWPYSYWLDRRDRWEQVKLKDGHLLCSYKLNMRKQQIKGWGIAYHFENVGNFCNFIGRQILQQRYTATNTCDSLAKNYYRWDVIC